MHYALTQNNIVTHVLRVPPESIYGPEVAAQYTPCSEDVQVGWLWQGGEFVAPPPTPPSDRKAAAWERIKADRDRRKSLGVKVGAHWYHSDAESRIQQLSLFVMGSNVPPVQWKTLTASGAPVFVTMTQSIAAGIFQGTAASDAAVFAAAEAHRVAMEASSTPETYDLSGGWPAGFGDA